MNMQPRKSSVVAKRRRGRPAGGSGAASADTRAAIVDEARRQFGELGYRVTTLRSVAHGAGVDPRLVLHYFGSKRELFLASIQLPLDPEQVIEHVFAGSQAEVAGRAVTLIVSMLDDPARRQSFIALIRAAVSEPEAAEPIRELLTERLLIPIAERVGGERSELRASMVASQIVGLALARHVVGIQPLAEASREQLIAALTPAIEHYFRGDWIKDDRND